MLVAIALAAAAAAALVMRPVDDRREGSVPIDGARFRFVQPATSYRVVYRSETFGEETVERRQELVVRRPFEARLETHRGGRDRSTTINAFGRLKNDEAVFAVAPGPAPLDVRPDTFTRAASREGLLEAREVRRVAGRSCRVLRTRGPETGPLEAVDEDAETYSERCFDRRGILLEEVSVSDGEVRSRRLATEVSEDPRIEDDTFETGDPTIPVDKGGGSVQRLAEGSKPPGDFFEARRDPTGLEHHGRYAVIPPQTGFDDPVERNKVVAFTSDVWTDGVDVVVVEQGATLGGAPPFQEAEGGVDVELGEAGSGQLVFNPVGAEVRALLGGGSFLRVFGTVPPDDLARVARGLEQVEGGTIVVDEGS